MLRTLDIPAREAVGFVPGPYNPITDLYDVQARDAHAWVQVWFPGYGWQDFDPTASVPMANPSPGGILLRQGGRLLAGFPALTLGSVAGLAGGCWLAVSWRRRRPATSALAASRRMERFGARAGRPRRLHETLSEYAAVLDDLERAPPRTFRALATEAEAAAYGDEAIAQEAERVLRGALAGKGPFALSGGVGVKGPRLRTRRT